MSVIAWLPWGYIATYDDNEVEIVSTVADPPKVRLAVLAENVSAENQNLGLVTFNTKRMNVPGSAGEQDEWCGVGGRLVPGVGGCVSILTKSPEQPGVTEAALFGPQGVVFNVPIVGALPRRVALRSLANGKLVCAEAGGSQPLIANRDNAGPWETFEVIAID